MNVGKRTLSPPLSRPWKRAEKFYAEWNRAFSRRFAPRKAHFSSSPKGDARAINVENVTAHSTERRAKNVGKVEVPEGCDTKAHPSPRAIKRENVGYSA
mgnify:CR=1 FL=1